MSDYDLSPTPLQLECERLQSQLAEAQAEIERMKAQAQEPVAWVFTVNKSHSIFCAVKPPEDAYDKGTLYPLYAAPPDLAANVAELEAEIVRLKASPTIEACRQMIDAQAVKENAALYSRIFELEEQVKVARSSIDEYLAANDPSEFGCACDLSVGHLCGPCHAHKQQTVLRAALTKLQGAE